MERCDRPLEDCANLAMCFMERLDQLQRRLRTEEERNEATFNKMIQNIAQEVEKPPGQRKLNWATYEEVIALRREIETASRICTHLDKVAQSKLRAWLGEETGVPEEPELEQ